MEHGQGSHLITPLGHPIANTQIYLLNEYLQPVPIGVSGELYIGGTNLARGYLNRPDLTAERFIAHPFSDEPAARLYKTGDLARYGSDGAIEFLGRRDHQVKIRGFRIELGEIEAALHQNPTVRECKVVVHEHPAGSKRLVAYLIPVGDEIPSQGELRRYLTARLPEYMIPATFVSLSTWPLTPHGKVDLGALSAETHTWTESVETYVAPQTLLEHLVA